jgi:hypothetical protein
MTILPPGARQAAAIQIPDDLALERFDPAAVPGWDTEDSQPIECNFITNPTHPDAACIVVMPSFVMPSFDIVWEGRLFDLA